MEKIAVHCIALMEIGSKAMVPSPKVYCSS